MSLSDYVVTEAGFGSELGAEKFINIKCRRGNLPVACIVVVVNNSHIDMDNIKLHIKHIEQYGIPYTITLNINKNYESNDSVVTKTYELEKYCESRSIPFSRCTSYSDGKKGANDLAKTIKKISNPIKPVYLYEYHNKLENKIKFITAKAYNCKNVIIPDELLEKLENYDKTTISNSSICISKSPKTLSGTDDIDSIAISDIEYKGGSKLFIVHTDSIIDMPGLSKHPNLFKIKIDSKGKIEL